MQASRLSAWAGGPCARARDASSWLSGSFRACNVRSPPRPVAPRQSSTRRPARSPAPRGEGVSARRWIDPHAAALKPEVADSGREGPSSGGGRKKTDDSSYTVRKVVPPGRVPGAGIQGVPGGSTRVPGYGGENRFQSPQSGREIPTGSGVFLPSSDSASYAPGPEIPSFHRDVGRVGTARARRPLGRRSALAAGLARLLAAARRVLLRRRVRSPLHATPVGPSGSDRVAAAGASCGIDGRFLADPARVDALARRRAGAQAPPLGPKAGRRFPPSGATSSLSRSPGPLGRSRTGYRRQEDRVANNIG